MNAPRADSQQGNNPFHSGEQAIPLWTVSEWGRHWAFLASSCIRGGATGRMAE